MRKVETKKLQSNIVNVAWILVLGALPPMLDTTIVNIAVNNLAQVFSAPLAVTQWVVTGYVLALATAVPLSGWLVRRFDGYSGPRKLDTKKAIDKLQSNHEKETLTRP